MNMQPMNPASQLAHSRDISVKVATLFQKRTKIAQQLFTERVQKALNARAAELMANPVAPWNFWTDWYRYSIDFAQRSVLFMDTLRQRGNNYVEHVRQGQPPLLHFAHEMVLDGRGFKQPVNYALVRILPPEGVTVDPSRRPYIIMDPRAGHGPGIGGFK